MAAELRLKELLGELVHTLDIEVSAIGIDVAIGLNLVVGQIVISHEAEARLRHGEAVRNLPPLQEKGKVITAVVRGVHLSNLYGVIGEIVVDDERQVVPSCVEAEDFTIVVQELLLRGHTAATERFLHELLQVGGFLNLRLLVLSLGKVVPWKPFSRGLRLFLYFKELASVLITVVYSDLLSKDEDLLTDAEIERHHCEATAVRPQKLASLEEVALGHSTIDFLGLNDHN